MIPHKLIIQNAFYPRFVLEILIKTNAVQKVKFFLFLIQFRCDQNIFQNMCFRKTLGMSVFVVKKVFFSLFTSSNLPHEFAIVGIKINKHTIRSCS